MTNPIVILGASAGLSLHRIICEIDPDIAPAVEAPFVEGLGSSAIEIAIAERFVTSGSIAGAVFAETVEVDAVDSIIARMQAARTAAVGS